jgi:uncharacterized protein YyaL (SSP411 family)
VHDEYFARFVHCGAWCGAMFAMGIRTRYALLALIILLLILLLTSRRQRENVEEIFENSYDAVQHTMTKNMAFLAKHRDSRDQLKRDRIEEMMLHAWNGYKTHAWGHDELKPISKQPHDRFTSSLLITPLAALDTLYIMGLHAEFREAKKLVLDKLDLELHIRPNVQDISSEMLGSLLACYELDQDPNILKKARYLADKLLYAVNRETGFPRKKLNLKSYLR